MKKLIVLFCCLCLGMTGFAQQEIEETPIEKLEQQTQSIADNVTKLKKFKISGYVQLQFQYGEKDASLKVGAANANPEKSFYRVGIRRGRIKFTYEEGIASGVFQLDITEKGVGVKDVYFTIKDPWLGIAMIKGGIFDRPFGYEISYSSSRRESPERSTIFQTLFPDERDLGASITLQAPKTSPWSILKLEAGMFAGNGIKLETDNRMDFIGHLSANKNINDNIHWDLGVSYYYGGVYQGTENVFSMQDKSFILSDEASNKGKFAKREYFGFDGQFNVISLLGMTQLKGEYLFGTQPGGKSNSKSPNASTLPNTDTYIRNFSGGYVIFVQDLGKLPLSVVFKYDWYNPNTKVAKNDVGLNGTGMGDLAQSTIGFGMLWRATNSIRLQAFYEINNNEKTENITKVIEGIKNDVFTFRVQYKF